MFSRGNEIILNSEDQEIRRFFTRVDPSDDEIARIVEIVVGRGGLEYAQDKASEYADRAREALGELPGGQAVDSLEAAVSYAVDRKK